MVAWTRADTIEYEKRLYSTQKVKVRERKRTLP